MIIGQCPYCDGTITNEMPERTPAYSQQTCPNCSKEYWMVHSRIESVAWQKDAFEAAHDIDRITRMVTPKTKEAMSKENKPKPDHSLKCWRDYYNPLLSGDKPFDVRVGEDRVFQIGQVVEFREWNPLVTEYTGRSFCRKITYVMHGGLWLPENVWVLGLSRDMA